MTYAPHSNDNSNPQPQQQVTKATAQTFSDNRESTSASLPLQTMMANSPQQQKLNAIAQLMATSPLQQSLKTVTQSCGNKPEPVQRMDEEEPVQGKFESEPARLESASDARPPNNTGLPDNLKSGMGNLSGMRLDHVKVHCNSPKPAAVQAHAYAGKTQRLTPMSATHPAIQKNGNGAQGFIGSQPEINVQMMLKDNNGHGANYISHGSFIEENKEEFLSVLKQNIYQMANRVLGKIGQTADQCPYIAKWFGYYSGKSGGHIEKAILRFSPDSVIANSMEEYIDIVTARVKYALEDHIETGSLKNVPEELVDIAYKPDDFLHIAEAKREVSQLACLDYFNSNTGGSTNELSEPIEKQNLIESSNKTTVKPKVHGLTEGRATTAKVGDSVVNVGTTSCGLVLGFCENGIGCYHWPFMTANASHSSIFLSSCKGLGELQKVIIITNEFPSQSETHYKQSAAYVKECTGVSLDYFVIEGQLNGDPWVELGEQSVTSKSGVLKQVAFDETD